MGYQLPCPCGEDIKGTGEDFLDRVNEHLRVAHAGRTYSDDVIMSMAYPWRPPK